MASNISSDDDNYDDGIIYAEAKQVLHPGRERQPGHGSSSTGNRDTGRRQHCKHNPSMSVLTLTGLVSGIKLYGTSKSDKKSLYRCDLENTIKNVKRSSGLDLADNEIFRSHIKGVQVYHRDGHFVKNITCSEVKAVWNVKVCDNLLYVSDNSKNMKVVLIIDKNGDVKSRLGLPSKEMGIEGGALGLAIDEITKDIFVSSCNTQTVYKCSYSSDHFKPFIISGLSEPCYLCVGPEHEVIVSNYKSHTISKYDSKAKFQWSYGGQGSGNGQLHKPTGICTDMWGNIYAADYLNNRVVQISSDGDFMSNVNFGEDFEAPQALAFRDNILIITTGLRLEREKKNKIYVIKCQFV